MTKLGSHQFDDFFRALWSDEQQAIDPFQWQSELAQRVLTNTDSPWPEAIALPTAAGKTACIDIAVFALAAQAHQLDHAKPIHAPRRIFFVVDRRLIVDEAFERAKKIVDKLKQAQQGILKTVADALCKISGTDQPLSAHLLRGGMIRSDAWAKNPLQPTIIASTVDQLGSRLLFRAYGRRPGMWPIYAGLAANDSLILLDEAHCAQAFLQTLKGVERYRNWAESPLQRCFHPVIVSATPPDSVHDRFEDQSDQAQDPEHTLGRRQLAHKFTRLEIASKAKGSKGTQALATELVKQAKQQISAQHRTIVIFVNRVATARAVYQLLTKGKNTEYETLLLTGRMRGADKQWVSQHQLPLLSSAQALQRDRQGEILEIPRIVVATQTLEVGADLDFDALVSECASLDALRQRFGRLNRMGRNITAQAVIVIRSDQQKDSGDDPIYGAALSNTWHWLKALEKSQSSQEANIDFGIAHLTPHIPKAEALNKLNAPALNAPVMLPSHVDAWAQTAPQPTPSPDVALFLHGPRNAATDVQVCFRADLDLHTPDAQASSLELINLCPPNTSECLAVPITAFKHWMAGATSEDDSADIEGSDTTVSTNNNEPLPNSRPLVLWQTTAPSKVIHSAREVRPGHTIVIPIATNCWKGLGDFPEKAIKTADHLDIGDSAWRLARAKNRLRLHPRLIALWTDETAQTSASKLLENIEDYDNNPEALVNEVRHLLKTLASSSNTEPSMQWLPDTAHGLLDEFSGAKLKTALHHIGDHELVVIGQRLIPELATNADHFSDAGVINSSATTSRSSTPIYLHQHLPGVEGFAHTFAYGCGLNHELVNAIALAGLLHDVGKADPRFQAILDGGSHWLASKSSKKLLAKSAHIPKSRAARQAAQLAAGYPEGGRHELLSVRLAESVPELLPEEGPMRDLVLHLVASHHGHCRPFAPIVFDESQQTVYYTLNDQTMQWKGATNLERLDSGVSDRYWRLIRRYGWWGLAWLEALLRLADHRRSEWEEMQ